MKGIGFGPVIWILCSLVYCGNLAAENIDPCNDGSQYAYGENVGWLNFEPSQGPGVTVSDTQLTGYVWAENVGWIKLDPCYGGVTNDGAGSLSGYAWAENVGWISFSCENTASCGAVDYGITIDSAGDFDGWAWAENIGWIHFQSASPVAYKVQTGWAPAVPPCWECLTQCHGDTDCDGDVDTVDWPIFRDAFGYAYPDASYHPCADLDHDGDVDTADWPEFRDNFGFSATADCTPGGTWPPTP